MIALQFSKYHVTSGYSLASEYTFDVELTGCLYSKGMGSDHVTGERKSLICILLGSRTKEDR